MKKEYINFSTIQKIVDENRNDADLGSVVRKLYWDFTENNEEENLENC